jgi:S-adenosylmethionine-diacylglycerol 3-amino-3-carboxypropyl transferase
MSRTLVRNAARHDGQGTGRAVSERLFALAFDDLVYTLIWEDPAVDLAAMELRPGMTMAAIASAGCNLLAYLTADPARVIAVDLLEGHLALLELKRAGLQALDDDALHRFFARAAGTGNLEAYRRQLAPLLSAPARSFWEHPSLFGRRRIDRFATGFWRSGLLGRFIGFAHLAARLHGLDPKGLLDCPDLTAQRRWFDRELRPVLRAPLLRFLLRRPEVFFGLGIPPNQFQAMAEGDGCLIASVEARLERLACTVPHGQNPFARQAFGREFGRGDAALPMWLERRHLPDIRARAVRIDARHQDFTERLRGEPACSIDRFVLLDAMDWMTDRRLAELWSQIERTAAPDARVIFRTAGAVSIIEGRLPRFILDGWHYERQRSLELFRQDRSAIYGGFHLYLRRPA